MECRLSTARAVVSRGSSFPTIPYRLPRNCRLRVRAESPIVEEDAGRPVDTPVFNRTRWTYHRNTGRYARHMKSIFRSVTFQNLQGPLSWLTLISCCVVLYRTLVDLDGVPDVFQGIRFTDVPFQLTSFALSLLLVFRTDASYSRWCAAMDAWSALRYSSAQLTRKAASWIHQPAALQRLVRWAVAFTRVLMVELRYDRGTAVLEAAMREELRSVLRPHEVEQIVSSGPYYHQFCLSVLTALVEAAQLGESREAALLEDLTGFNRAGSECEKILRFPIPLTYTRHTSRFMLIYLAALPLALYDSCDWAVVPVTLVIAFLLLGIEDIGVQIEEPFSILPLPEICADLQTIAQRAIAQRNLVRCLADPDTCTFDPENPDQPYGTGQVAGGAEGSATSSEDDGSESSRPGGSGEGSNGSALGSRVGTARDSPYTGYEKGKGLVVAVAEVGDSTGNGNGHGSSGSGMVGNSLHR